MQNRKHYKNRGFSGNCKKNKNDTFFGKRCFLTWLKKWVLLTVFSKSCVFLKTLVLQSWQQSTAFEKQKLYVENTEIYEKLWVVIEHGKMLFLGVCFFKVLIMKGLFLVCLALFQ